MTGAALLLGGLFGKPLYKWNQERIERISEAYLEGFQLAYGGFREHNVDNNKYEPGTDQYKYFEKGFYDASDNLEEPLEPRLYVWARREMSRRAEGSSDDEPDGKDVDAREFMRG